MFDCRSVLFRTSLSNIKKTSFGFFAGIFFLRPVKFGWADIVRFNSLKKELAKLPVGNAIIDGEIVCLDAQGVSQFYQLLSRKAEPVFYAFDLLWLNGEDLRNQPLTARKK